MLNYHHSVADCPKCNKHDFVEEENGYWICLSCGYSRNSQTHHSVADCPRCGKRDFVEGENNQWHCLKCGFSRDLLKPESDSGGTVLVAILTVLIVLILLSV